MAEVNAAVFDDRELSFLKMAVENLFGVRDSHKEVARSFDHGDIVLHSLFKGPLGEEVRGKIGAFQS